MTDKSTTVTARKPDGKHTNPSLLVWPADNTGFTTMVRKEGARAVGRITGDPERLAVFMATLRVLAEHAAIKVKAQVEAKAQGIADIQRAKDAAAEVARKDAELEVARLATLLAVTQARLDTLVPAAPVEDDNASGEPVGE